MAYLPPVNIPSLGGKDYARDLYGMISGVGEAYYGAKRDTIADQQWQQEQERLNTAQALAQSNADRNYALELRTADLNDKKFNAEMAGGGGFGYDGTSMDAQNWDIINSGNVNDPRYRSAYYMLFEQPKMTQVETPEGVKFIPQMPPRPDWVIQPPSSGGGSVVPESGATTALGGAASNGIGAPITVPGTKPRATVEETKGGMLIENIEQDYNRLAGGMFDALASTGETFAGRFGTAGRMFQSADYQIAYDSAKNIVQSYIYAVSGAQAPDSEVERNMALILPNEADTPETIAVKRQRLDGMMNAIRAKAHQPIAQGVTPRGLQVIEEQ